ncbi:hypothetical protein B9Z19DRAFT_1084866 [Tuber borchii]|uniref:Uncharacterized protein n=1 Tax=Tuber borchii TaxID=42251 RepID=A0A2T6ZRC8_TUBBO|nr:hypothetical protein B9Z19DRAFT_1084866 [Tuber borchii]
MAVWMMNLSTNDFMMGAAFFLSFLSLFLSSYIFAFTPFFCDSGFLAGSDILHGGPIIYPHESQDPIKPTTKPSYTEPHIDTTNCSVAPVQYRYIPIKPLLVAPHVHHNSEIGPEKNPLFLTLLACDCAI